MKDLSSRGDPSATYLRPVGEDEGDKRLLRPRLSEQPAMEKLHRVTAGDRLDLLAARYFGDPNQYFRIADANPCIHPDELLEPGRILRIPRGG